MRWVFQRQAVAGLVGIMGVVGVVALGGCAGADGDVAPAPGRINHVVFFKLLDPAGADELITACDTMAGEIPVIVSSYAGRHVDTGRDTVDGDYDVGFYVGFDSEASYAAYVEHPAHQELVAIWGPRLQWWRVYDVLDAE